MKFLNYIILLKIWLLLFHVIVCIGGYGKTSYDQLDSDYKDEVEQEIVKAPLSFMPGTKKSYIFDHS